MSGLIPVLVHGRRVYWSRPATYFTWERAMSRFACDRRSFAKTVLALTAAPLIDLPQGTLVVSNQLIPCRGFKWPNRRVVYKDCDFEGFQDFMPGTPPYDVDMEDCRMVFKKCKGYSCDVVGVETRISLNDYVSRDDGEWGEHGPNDVLEFDAHRELVHRKADRFAPPRKLIYLN